MAWQLPLLGLQQAWQPGRAPWLQQALACWPQVQPLPGTQWRLQQALQLVPLQVPQQAPLAAAAPAAPALAAPSAAPSEAQRPARSPLLAWLPPAWPRLGGQEHSWEWLPPLLLLQAGRPLLVWMHQLLQEQQLSSPRSPSLHPVHPRAPKQHPPGRRQRLGRGRQHVPPLPLLLPVRPGLGQTLCEPHAGGSLPACCAALCWAPCSAAACSSCWPRLQWGRLKQVAQVR